jgi:diaminohydroxyphosphoribosylaminopyrimidine deaminase/5-amino-6-(5-phosphoribosylamino)uracil reductase
LRLLIVSQVRDFPMNSDEIHHDELHMRKALDLALAGVGLVSPNPAVGAVVVDKSGREVGTGTHSYEGKKHAEVIALEQSGEAGRGGTLYVNLEPCSHHGRTGPCADAVIAAGIRRVVCSMEDPNPQVAGKGFARLRAAGIHVEVGLFQREARKLNEGFARFIRTRLPFVTLKCAMSLDGKIAAAHGTKDEADGWISGPAAHAHVQQVRHQNDAILVGVGTVIADDPLLTDRSGLPRRRKLLRVILDSSLRLPLTSRIVSSVADDLVVICSSPARRVKQTLEDKGIRVIELPGSARPAFSAVLNTLGEMEITSLLVEGGSMANASALASGQVDKILLYFAPKLLGPAAVPFLAEVGEGNRALSVKQMELHRFGDDFAVEGYLRDPYAE